MTMHTKTKLIQILDKLPHEDWWDTIPQKDSVSLPLSRTECKALRRMLQSIVAIMEFDQT